MQRLPPRGLFHRHSHHGHFRDVRPEAPLEKLASRKTPLVSSGDHRYQRWQSLGYHYNNYTIGRQAQTTSYSERKSVEDTGVVYSTVYNDHPII